MIDGAFITLPRRFYMKIIKAGRKPKTTLMVTCPNCEAELEICRRDIKKRLVEDPDPDDFLDCLFSYYTEYYYICGYCKKDVEIEFYTIQDIL